MVELKWVLLGFEDSDKFNVLKISSLSYQDFHETFQLELVQNPNG